MPEDPRYTPRTGGQSSRQTTRTRSSMTDEQRAAARQRVAQRRAAGSGRTRETQRATQSGRPSADRAERPTRSNRAERSTRTANTSQATRTRRNASPSQPTQLVGSYQSKKRSGGLPLRGIALVVLGILVIGAGAWGLKGLFSGSGNEEPIVPVNENTRVTFVAVGDNLPDEAIGNYADACAGKKGDGDYDYTPIYQYIKPLVEAADLSYVKQETHCGGDDIGPKGYPSFNTTDQMADAIIDTGFDLIGSASNHCYDWGYFGAAKHSRELWAQKEVAYTGTATSEEQAQQLAIVQRNGITFCLLDYTYGVNAYEEEDLPAGTTNFISEERITTDVQRAKEVADVVLVAMHWGEENQTYASEFQMKYAKILTELEVDVILGSHPHVIGPVEWQTSESGHKTLIAYSLGNFLSNHETPDGDNQLEGMLSCTFVKDAASGEIAIEDALWTPLVNHNVPGEYAVYPVSQYTAELAAKNPVFGGKDLSKEGWAKDPLTWLVEHTQKVVGKDITVAGMAEVQAAKDAAKAAKAAEKEAGKEAGKESGTDAKQAAAA